MGKWGNISTERDPLPKSFGNYLTTRQLSRDEHLNGGQQGSARPCWWPVALSRGDAETQPFCALTEKIWQAVLWRRKPHQSKMSCLSKYCWRPALRWTCFGEGHSPLGTLLLVGKEQIAWLIFHHFWREVLCMPSRHCPLFKELASPHGLTMEQKQHAHLVFQSQV